MMKSDIGEYMIEWIKSLVKMDFADIRHRHHFFAFSSKDSFPSFEIILKTRVIWPYSRRNLLQSSRKFGVYVDIRITTIIRKGIIIQT